MNAQHKAVHGAESAEEGAANRSSFDLIDQRAVVTGGAKGIGRAAALALAAAGADVLVFDVLEDALRDLAEQCEDHGYHVATVTGDAERKSDIDRLVERARRPKAPDIIVNNVGKTLRKELAETGVDELEKLWRVNFKATFQLTQALLPAMIERRSGRIINVGSLGQQFGLPERGAYAITKGALAQYTRALAAELGPHGICVNTIAPGYIRTDLTGAWLDGDEARTEDLVRQLPLQRIGTPDDVSGTFVFLASPAADYITGQTIFVDGGWSSV